MTSPGWSDDEVVRAVSSGMCLSDPSVSHKEKKIIYINKIKK